VSIVKKRIAEPPSLTTEALDDWEEEGLEITREKYRRALSFVEMNEEKLNDVALSKSVSVFNCVTS
jgi:hypothetical protein